MDEKIVGCPLVYSKERCVEISKFRTGNKCLPLICPVTDRFSRFIQMHKTSVRVFSM